VKVGDLPGQRRQYLRSDLAAPEALEKCGRLREALHLDGPLDGLARPLDSQPGERAGDGDDAVVNSRRQPAVEPDLLLTEVTPALEGGEVQEAEIDGLLDLVGVRAGEEDDRDVRLADLNPIDRVGIGSGLRQRGDQSVELHDRLPGARGVDPHATPRPPRRCHPGSSRAGNAARAFQRRPLVLASLRSQNEVLANLRETLVQLPPLAVQLLPFHRQFMSFGR
jgi:hypothetical protein